MINWACADLHGCLDAYKKIKEFIKPDDKVYCLGDCGDRGPEPWNTIKAVATDPQFIYIKGNHEDMLVKAAREVFNFDYDPYCHHQRVLASNGGADTLERLLGEESPERWVSHLAKLPTHIIYTNPKGQEIFLCHAGCSFWKDEEFTLPSADTLLWDRLHYFDNAKLLNDTIVVHGHTPMKYIASDLNIPLTAEALKYANGKKYCIDAGTCFNGLSILLNLDTFESIMFKIKD